MSERAQRYSAVAIVLHWAIAVAIAINLPLGFWMHEQAEHGDVGLGVFQAYQLHKSIGLTVLGLTVLRLVWRLLNPPPALPPHMPGWEKFVAKATHWVFYALMLLLPVSGWIYVSAGWSIHDNAPLSLPTHWFGLFDVPHLFGLSEASHAVRAQTAGATMTAHAYMAFAMIGLAALHVLAALKHHFFDRDAVLAHMVPGLRAPFETEAAPKNPVRLAVLGAGLGLTAVAAALALFTIANLGAAPAQTPPSTFEVVDNESAPATDSVAPAPDATAPPQPPASATQGVPAWSVDQRTSAISFAYTYQDEDGATPFNGRFSLWRADIRFDPNDLGHSSAVVTIETASAATGVAAHDAALPTAEWFNAAANPTATFRTTRIRARADRQYEARGDLTIRGQTRAVDLPFTLTIDGNRASMSGRASIDRHDFGIGENGSGDDLISRTIDLTIRVDAVRAH